MTDLVGASIGGYRLTRRLGSGGMGEVYEAHHAALGRTVAIKVLAPGEPGLTQRFLNEARVHAQLQHPNVVTLYDFLDFGGRPCIVMELVRGETLDDRIQRLGALPLSEAVFVLQALTHAIAHVHDKGIVHRDVKAANVKITPDGEVKLLDFGIARAHALPRMTVEGRFVGTLQYSSPEQLRGEAVDARCDLWALGVLLYEMVTARMPFEATSMPELLEKIQKASYPRAAVLNPRVPKEVEAVIARCLARRIESRYADASALARDAVALGRVVSSPRLSTTRTGPWARLDRWRSRLASAPSRRLRGFAAAAAAAGAIGLAWLALAGGPEPGTPGAVATRSAVEAVASLLIDSPTGRAEVWIDGIRVGETPWRSQQPVGARVQITLRRPGYLDRTASFEIHEHGNAYSYPLRKKR